VPTSPIQPLCPNVRTCSNCHVRYEWKRSGSALKFTYCSILCEQGGLGFTIEAAIKMERVAS